eukprot:1662180-Prymnesium_polylepis.2
MSSSSDATVVSLLWTVAALLLLVDRCLARLAALLARANEPEPEDSGEPAQPLPASAVASANPKGASSGRSAEEVLELFPKEWAPLSPVEREMASSLRASLAPDVLEAIPSDMLV